MLNTMQMKNVHKDLLLILLIAAISIVLVVLVWQNYVEDIELIEQRINQTETNTSNNK